MLATQTVLEQPIEVANTTVRDSLLTDPNNRVPGMRVKDTSTGIIWKLGIDQSTFTQDPETSGDQLSGIAQYAVPRKKDGAIINSYIRRNVLDAPFNADPTGVVDATAAIQAAWDAGVGDLGPPGTVLKVNGKLFGRSNLKVIGKGVTLAGHYADATFALIVAYGLTGFYLGTDDGLTINNDLGGILYWANNIDCHFNFTTNNWIGKLWNCDSQYSANWKCSGKLYAFFGPHDRAGCTGQIVAYMHDMELYCTYRMESDYADSALLIGNSNSAGMGYHPYGTTIDLITGTSANNTYSGASCRVEACNALTIYHVSETPGADIIFDVGKFVAGVVSDVTEIDGLKYSGTLDGAVPIALGVAIPSTAHDTLIRVTDTTDYTIPGRAVSLRGIDGANLVREQELMPKNVGAMHVFGDTYDHTSATTISAANVDLALNTLTRGRVEIAATTTGCSIRSVGYSGGGLDFNRMRKVLVNTGTYGFPLLHQDAGATAAFRINTPDGRPVWMPANGDGNPCVVVLVRDPTNSFWNVESIRNGYAGASLIDRYQWSAYLDASVGVKTSGGTNIVKAFEQDSQRIWTPSGGTPTLVAAMNSGHRTIACATPAILGHQDAAVWGVYNGAGTGFVMGVKWRSPHTVSAGGVVTVYASGGSSCALQLYIASSTQLAMYRVNSAGANVNATKTIATDTEYVICWCLHNDGKLYTIDENGTSAGLADVTGTLSGLDTATINGKIGAPGTDAGFIEKFLWRAPVVAANTLTEMQALYAELKA